MNPMKIIMPLGVILAVIVHFKAKAEPLDSIHQPQETPQFLSVVVTR